MTVTEYLEENKEALISRLGEAKTPERALPVLENAIDRLLYACNGEDRDEGYLLYAASMLRAAKAQLPLLAGIGSAEVWERAPEARRGGASPSGRRRMAFLPALLLILSAVLAAAGFLSSLTGRSAPLGPGVVLSLAAAAAGSVLLAFFSGKRVSAGARGKGETARMTTLTVDPEKIFRTLKTTCLVIDQELKEYSAGKGTETVEEITKEAPGERELSLYAGLLEALYSGDRDYAFDKLGELRGFLRTRNIDVEDYAPGREAWFDMMPSKEAGTLRPALVSEGRLLRKGMASAGSV